MLLGLVLAKVVTFPIHWIFLVAAILTAVSAIRSRRWYACVLIAIVGIVIGLARGTGYAVSLSQLSHHVGSNVVLVARISQDPLQKEGTTQWQTQLNHIQILDKMYSGEVYATIVSDEKLQRGDIVTIQSKATEGFGSFQLAMYRAELLDHVRNKDVFITSRDIFAEGTRRVMPEPEASLGLGFVVGQKSALPTDLQDQLKVVGLTHIVVASGYNLTILVRFARRVLARRSRYLAFMGSSALVAGFVAVSGLSPSMNRAAVVTGLSLLAWYYGRKFHPVQLILYVACLSAFLYPVYVWGDLGWLLSFSAFTGVLVVAPIITRWLLGVTKEPGAASQLVIETLAAEMMTLPILIVAFGYVPTFALLANVLVAPVIPFAMLCTFIAGIVGIVTPYLWILALPASIIIGYIVSVVNWLANISWAQIDVILPVWWAVVWYGIIAILLTFIWRKKRIHLHASSIIE